MPLVNTKRPNYHYQQFKITFSNNLLDFDLSLYLYIDGERTNKRYVRAGQRDQILGITKTLTSVLPFKFQELELVGAFSSSIRWKTYSFSFATEDPDVENAPVVPEMGTIELQAFRCHAQHTAQYKPHAANRLRQGRVSERSKKAGWHRVR